MSNPDPNGPNDQTDEVKLSPEAQALMGKARRSFGISIGILLLGFMAIGFALVYRVMRDAPPPVVAESVTLPAGAEVISALNLDGQVQVTYRLGSETALVVFDAETGEVLRTIDIVGP